jgi:hypothetical protein
MTPKQSPCPKCYDKANDRITGVTRETAPVWKQSAEGKYVTLHLGSGCHVCHGRGIVLH